MDGRKRILLVDDDADSRETLSEFLVGEGYEVETAHDGVAGLRKLSRFQADLVVTDLQMPGLDGLELIERSRRSPTPPPAILITGVEGGPDETETTESGALAWLCKPVDLEDLKELVEQALHSDGQVLSTESDAMDGVARGLQSNPELVDRDEPALREGVQVLRGEAEARQRGGRARQGDSVLVAGGERRRRP